MGDEDLRFAARRAAAFTADWPDDTLIVRGGTDGIQQLQRRRMTHPAYPPGTMVGWSVQSRPGRSMWELAAPLPHHRIRVTSLGQLRAAGGALARTPGGYEHCTVTGIDAVTFDAILSAPRTRMSRVR